METAFWILDTPGLEGDRDHGTKGYLDLFSNVPWEKDEYEYERESVLSMGVGNTRISRRGGCNHV